MRHFHCENPNYFVRGGESTKYFHSKVPRDKIYNTYKKDLYHSNIGLVLIVESVKTYSVNAFLLLDIS